MKACEHFLTVLHAHVVATAEYLIESSQVNVGKAEDAAKEITIRFVYFNPDVKVNTTDKVFLYCL